MKHNRLLSIFILGSLALTACTEEALWNESMTTTLRASIEQPAGTRTSLSEPESGYYRTLWSEQDAIMVFVEENDGRKFKLKKGSGTTIGEFYGELYEPQGKSHKKIAVYPHSIVEDHKGDTVSVSLPEFQTYVKGNIANGAYPMVAVTDGLDLNFKNLCSVLKISMTGNQTVNSIIFVTNNPSVRVSGEAKIAASNASLTMGSFTSTRVVLQCGGVRLSDKATDFNIVVPSQTYKGGFSLVIDTDKGKVSKTIGSDVTLKRSELYRITPFMCEIDENNNNVFFEDPTFKAYVVANYDKDNNGEISFEEALDITKIEVETETISSLVGIERMTNLQFLFCSGSMRYISEILTSKPTGLLTSLDVSALKKLKYLDCRFNKLKEIDVSKNPELYRLDVAVNLLTSIDIGGNPLLRSCDFNNNSVTSIDISRNPELSNLDCRENRISQINVSGNPKLYHLECSKNRISQIDVSGNPELYILDCSENRISQINVSGNPELYYLDCSENRISQIDVSHNSKLEKLICFDNNISELDLSKNSSLSVLSFAINRISTIDLKYCPKIKKLYCGSNGLKSIDLSWCPEIEELSVLHNDIEVLDIRPLTSLKWLKALNNPLKTLYVLQGQLDNLDYEIPEETNIVSGTKPYSSIDYTQDGKVTKLHSATVGNGIDVVFVGEAFADKDQGLFNKYVDLGVQAFLAEEPFKSTKDRFNIYRIGSVSENGTIAQEGGRTKFSVMFGEGTSVVGDNEKVYNFVTEAMPSVDLTKTTILTVVNKRKYAGTSTLSSANRAICYIPLCTSETEYGEIVRHEGCGHGFGKLADEYDEPGITIPQSQIDHLLNWRSYAYGFYENVDITSEPDKILWSRFLSDNRYAGKVGIFEGGYTFGKGVYRPTDNSIMRYNTGGFNAPSREAIYKKIMKFSVGDGWAYDYEAFVAFDTPARSAAAVTRAAQSASVDKANFIPLAPPVMIEVD